MNNNSTDNTLEKLRELPVFIVEEKQQGTIWARRAGVACAETQWVAVIDDDVTLLDGWLDSMRSFVTEFPFADAVTSRILTPLPNHLFWAKSILAENPSDTIFEYGHGSPPMGTAFMCRRNVFLEFSKRPKRLGRDDVARTLSGGGEDIELFKKAMLGRKRVFHNGKTTAIHEIEEWRKNFCYLKQLQDAYADHKYIEEYWLS